MYQLKQMLNDLVDYVYKDDPRLKAYKAFYIEVVDKKYRRHGDYNPRTYRIRIMNLYRNENKLIITAVHELSHHINHMQGNKDIHGKGFYANYEKLLHGTLDMGLVKKEEWLAAKRRRRDSQSENKVEKMILSYNPQNSSYKAGFKKIIVYGAYDIKEELKEMGYTYNKIVRGWEKEIEENDSDNMKKYLDTKGVKYTISDANKYIVKDAETEKKRNSWTLSVQNAYPIKDFLKEKGYYYRMEDYCWCKKYMTGDEVDVLLNEIKSLCVKYNIGIEHFDNQKLCKYQEIRLTLKKHATPEEMEVMQNMSNNYFWYLLGNYGRIITNNI